MKLGPVAQKILRQAFLGRPLTLNPEEVAKLAALPEVIHAGAWEAARVDSQCPDFPGLGDQCHGREVRR